MDYDYSDSHHIWNNCVKMVFRRAAELFEDNEEPRDKKDCAEDVEEDMK